MTEYGGNDKIEYLLRVCSLDEWQAFLGAVAVVEGQRGWGEQREGIQRYLAGEHWLVLTEQLWLSMLYCLHSKQEQRAVSNYPTASDNSPLHSHPRPEAGHEHCFPWAIHALLRLDLGSWEYLGEAHRGLDCVGQALRSRSLCGWEVPTDVQFAWGLNDCHRQR